MKKNPSVTDPHQEEREAIALLQNYLATGHERSFNKLYRHMNPWIQAVVARRLYAAGYGNRAHVMDAVGFVWLRLCEHDFRVLRRFQPNDEGRGLRAYLRTIASTKATDWLKTHRQDRMNAGIEPDRVPQERTEERYIQKDMLEKTVAMLNASFSSRRCALFLNMTAGGYTTPEEMDRSGATKDALNSLRRDGFRATRSFLQKMNQEVRG